MDEDGYIFLKDRLKDMIVSGGENIYPAEVENAIMSHPGVQEVAVIGIPSERWGESPYAVVVAKPGVTLSVEDVLDHTRGRLARFKCPSGGEVIDALPRNPSGKILKRELRAPFWDNNNGRTIG